MMTMIQALISHGQTMMSGTTFMRVGVQHPELLRLMFTIHRVGNDLGMFATWVRTH